ncbi:MAG: hypothetical protein QME51_11840, partial [Planctomycetota bacterium]|nr:hypothetical protein [Planctomycetota bacterium]
MNNKQCIDPFCIHHHKDIPDLSRRGQNKIIWIINELIRHLPYSIISVIGGVSVMVALTMLDRVQYLVGIFHLFHPTHLLLSATATTAMFWRFSYRRPVQGDRNNFFYVGRYVIYAILIGFTGSVGVCSLSDIVFPYLAGKSLGWKIVWHFCLTQHSMTVLPFIAIGILIGFWSGAVIRYSTFLSHSLHVFVSTMASVIYLITFGMTDWLFQIPTIFLITAFTVLFTCCFSDIIYPLIFVKGIRRAAPFGGARSA